MSLLGTLDFGKKITAIELWRVSPQDNYVGIEGEDCLYSVPIVSRDFKSGSAQHRDDVVSETIVGLHHQQFPYFGIHNTRFLGCAREDGWLRAKWAARPSRKEES